MSLTNDSRDEMELGEARGRELRSYGIGLGSALILTAIAFALIHFAPFGTSATRAGIFGLALVQVVVHFRYFLHIDLRKSARDDLQLILFSTLVIMMMAGGTLVIMFNLHERMM